MLHLNNLDALSTSVSLTIAQWIEEYGPLITIRSGIQTVVIIGRYNAAMDIMEIHRFGARWGQVPSDAALHTHLQPKSAEVYEPLQMSQAKNVFDFATLDGDHWPKVDCLTERLKMSFWKLATSGPFREIQKPYPELGAFKLQRWVDDQVHTQVDTHCGQVGVHKSASYPLAFKLSLDPTKPQGDMGSSKVMTPNFPGAIEFETRVPEGELRLDYVSFFIHVRMESRMYALRYTNYNATILRLTKTCSRRALRNASYVQNLPHTSGNASAACQRTGLVVKILPLPKAPQLNTLEHELMKSIEELTTRRRIIGGPLTADEILDPQQEKNVEEVTAYEDDDAIVAEVQRRQAIRSGELVEVESDDEDDPPKVCAIELIPLCEKLEAACVAHRGNYLVVYMSIV
ncbi:hypothetical protein BDR07DRAFT_1384182 [Suillus spraguei]|nr:hypothetical protein BDR07DRAFT_1384182 [Suillus spraguei]